MPGMGVVGGRTQSLVQRCFGAFWAVKRHLTRRHLCQRMVVVGHSVNDDLEVVHGFVPVRQRHLGFCPTQTCKEQIWRLDKQAFCVLERALWKVSTEVG